MSPGAPPEVECTRLSKGFDGGVEVLREIDLRIEAGRTTAFVGPSGCGKSTLLRLIAGLERPSSGAVEIGGRPPAETLRRAGLAVAFQDPSLLPWRTVRGNVELALKLARRRPRPRAVEDLIALVGLSGFGDARPAALSGGMRQRAAIARAMVTEPGLLLLDEPFGAVDELTRRQLAQDLPRLWEARETTAILVTHSIHEAVMLSDRVVVFSSRPARIVADVRIDLPRPRPAGTTADPHFLALSDRVSAALAKGMGDRADGLAAQ